MITMQELEALRDRLCKEKDEEKHHPDWKEGHVEGVLDMFNEVKKRICNCGEAKP